MNVRRLCFLILLVALCVVAIVPLVGLASPHADTIPVQDADGVFSTTTSLSPGLKTELTDMYYPCVIRSADGIWCIDLGTLPEFLISAFAQLPSTHFIVQSSDGISRLSTAAFSETLGLLFAQIPTSYLPIQSSDGARQFNVQAVSGTLANLIGNIPTSYLPVQSSDGVWAVSVAYPSELLRDTIPPQITAVTVDRITGLVEWKTDEFANSELRYGDGLGNLPNQLSNALWKRQHQMVMTEPTAPFLLIRVADQSGNTSEYYTPGYSIAGRVTDRKGDPIPNVVVSLSPTQVSITDDDGNYSLPGIPQGAHVLTANHAKYTFSPLTIPVSVSADLSGKNFVGESNEKSIYLPSVTR